MQRRETGNARTASGLRNRATTGAALPGWQPRPAKRTGGRTLPAPAHVRVIGVELGAEHRQYIRRKLGMKLGQFDTAIERVSVRVTDVNGPRGGIDQMCRVKVVLSGLPSVVVERRHAMLHGAIDSALGAVAQAVRRSVGRRRTKPLHGIRASTPTRRRGRRTEA